MINRSLIRIKTIQILYSYLLTRKDFHLVPEPTGDEVTADTQFAYSVYLDYLFLLLKLSSVPVDNKSAFSSTYDDTLKKNVVGKMLAKESEMSNVITKYQEHAGTFNQILGDIISEIREAPAYQKKVKQTLADCVDFWINIFSKTIAKSKNVENCLRKNELFSVLGMERGLNMFIMTLKSLDDTKDNYQKARQDLETSLTLAYNLYHALLMLPVRLTDVELNRIESARNKYLPTKEDLNPNMRLVENSFVKALCENKALMDYVADNTEADPANWKDSDILFSSLLDRIKESEVYKQYMECDHTDYDTDANLWRELLRNVILPSDELAEALENSSVYWNDDLSIMGTFVLKTIRRSYASNEGNSVAPDNYGKVVLLPKFMNSDDERFGNELFEFVIKNNKTYRSYIDRFIDVKQWDTERLAFMDIVLMETAIAEIINFPSIPIPVTFNEYIEIANEYSTPRSGQFINGIIYSVIKMLQEEKIITKK